MIYFDYASSTPCDPSVIDEIIPFFSLQFANPSNTTNMMGLTANKSVQKARGIVSDFLNCLPQQIIWTSGATESNNIAIRGSLNMFKAKSPAVKPHIIASAIEHKSVLEVCQNLSLRDVDLTLISPSEDGSTSIREIVREIRENTFLLSIMMANNEIGVINDIHAIGEACDKHGILLHCDATQYFGKLPINLRTLKIDFLSFSGHKIYAPKGIGGLYIKDINTISPITFGGGQEGGIRSGTLNVPGIIGLAKACKIYGDIQKEEEEKLISFRNSFESTLLSYDKRIIINGASAVRLPNISSITFPIKEGYNLLNILDDEKKVACSSGSACDSSDNKPSHVMKELGKTKHQAKNTLRFSFGRFTSEKDIKSGADHIIKVLKQIS